MSQLLARIERDLQVADSAVHRAELLARKGSYLARIGRFDDARKIVSELRQVFGDGRSGHVSAWIMLTEGVLHLFENLSPQAMDRVRRAQLLGLAMKDSSVVAIASAWKAHIEFEVSDFTSMVKSIETALSHAGQEDHDAHARVAMTISDSFLLCGDRPSAQHWFLNSRDHALKDGDQAGIEALLYNRAAFSLARLRAQRCLSEVDGDAISLVKLEIASAKNLQTLIGVAALTNFIQLCEARVLLLSGDFAAAIIALESVRHQKPFADYNFDQRFVDLEVAYCLAKLNRMAEADRLIQTIDLNAFDSLDIDEQLVAAWLVHQLSVIGIGKVSLEDSTDRLGGIASRYRMMCHELSTMLDPFRLSAQ